jgi:hypothetical protein
MTIGAGPFKAARGSAVGAGVLALVIFLGPIFSPAGSTAIGGIFHYPWCETIRDRCFAKAKVRKAECNWRYNLAKTNRVNGLSKWPSGVSNYCHIYPEIIKNDGGADSLR